MQAVGYGLVLLDGSVVNVNKLKKFNLARVDRLFRVSCPYIRIKLSYDPTHTRWHGVVLPTVANMCHCVIFHMDWGFIEVLNIGRGVNVMQFQ